MKQRYMNGAPEVPLGDLTPRIAEGLWVVDPKESRMQFSIKHFWGLGSVCGTFSKFEGKFELAENKVSAWVSLDANTVETGSARRNERLRSGHFFSVSSSPRITFWPETVVSLEPEHLFIKGLINARGQDQKILLNAKIWPLSEEVFELTGQTTLDHRSFGMGWGPPGFIQGPARLDVNIRFCREKRAEPPINR